MRCIELSQPATLDNIEVTERPDPTPNTGEILVRWYASSLNYHDLLVVNGSIPVENKRIPMADGAGEIVEVGEGVTNWQVGDKVMSLFFPDWHEGRATRDKIAAISGESVDGCARDLACVSAASVTSIPNGWSYEDAATLPTAAVTAWRAMMFEGQLKAGDTVLVEGTGGMSIFALQLAKAAGAYVFATTSSEEKASKLQSLGADEVINYKDDPKWGKSVNRLSGGGVDHVLDIGGGSTIDQSVAATRVGGHLALIGILGGRTGEVLFPQLFFKQLRMSGLAVGSAEMQRAMVRAINVSSLKPVIDKSFTLNTLGDAFRYQETGAHFGKIVVEY